MWFITKNVFINDFRPRNKFKKCKLKVIIMLQPYSQGNRDHIPAPALPK